MLAWVSLERVAQHSAGMCGCLVEEKGGWREEVARMGHWDSVPAADWFLDLSIYGGPWRPP